MRSWPGSEERKHGEGLRTLDSVGEDVEVGVDSLIGVHRESTEVLLDDGPEVVVGIVADSILGNIVGGGLESEGGDGDREVGVGLNGDGDNNAESGSSTTTESPEKVGVGIGIGSDKATICKDDFIRKNVIGSHSVDAGERRVSSTLDVSSTPSNSLRI